MNETASVAVTDYTVALCDGLKSVFTVTRNKLCGRGSINTPFPALDRLTGGISQGQLWGIGVKDRNMRSDLALNMVRQAVLNNEHRHPTLLFSTISPHQKVVRELLGLEGRVSRFAFYEDCFGTTDQERLTEAVRVMKDAPLFINDKTDLTINELHSCIMEHRKRHGVELVCIDGLQELHLWPHQGKWRCRMYIDVLSRLQMLARELDIAIVVFFKYRQAAGGNGAPMEWRQLCSYTSILAFLEQTKVVKCGVGLTLTIARNLHGDCGRVQLSYSSGYGCFSERF